MNYYGMLGAGWSNKYVNITTGLYLNRYDNYQSFYDKPATTPGYWGIYNLDIINKYSSGCHLGLDRTIWRGLGVGLEANLALTPYFTLNHEHRFGPPGRFYQTHRNIRWFALKVFWRQGVGKKVGLRE
ncbi:MAG: hypothetical protein WBA17_13300 [Saprospiraceae bacterium]